MRPGKVIYRYRYATKRNNEQLGQQRHSVDFKPYTNEKGRLGWEFIKEKSKILKLAFFWQRSCFLSFFIGQDRVFFLFCLGQDLVSFFSWSKVCFLSFFLLNLSFFLVESEFSFFFFLKSFPTSGYSKRFPDNSKQLLVINS